MAQDRLNRTLPQKIAEIFSCFRHANEERAHSEGGCSVGHGGQLSAERPRSADLASTSTGCKNCEGGNVSETAPGAGPNYQTCCRSQFPAATVPPGGWNFLSKDRSTPGGDGLPTGWCRKEGVGDSLPAIACTFPGAAPDTQVRSPSPALLLSLRNLHLALAPMDFSQQTSPLMTDSPCADTRPTSVDFIGLGFGEFTTSDSSDPTSMSSIHPQLRFASASKLADEVQDMQLLGRGGYGMVMTGNWKQEGRVAVKVLLSDEDKWMDSCYKEAVLSKVLAHPNILQTYDFQVAVLAPTDIARAKASWEDLQHRTRQQHLAQYQQQQQQQQQAARAADAGSAAGGGGSCSPPPPGTPPLSGLAPDPRADSFELLPAVCASGLDAARGSRPGALPTATDLWQVLFMLGARPGQFVTMIIMEYAEVGTLQRAIAAGSFRESARLSKWAALRSLLVTAKEVAGGMCLLHSYKIIHGDLSATNVMLRCSRIDKRGFVAKVADFGLSKVTLSGVARVDDWAGQAQYLAPERLDYEARLASDVFAFGVLLYEMASGRKAFAEYQPAQILAGRLAGDLELVWPADAPPELKALAERCMLQDPEARPSFREVVEELRRQDNEAKSQHRQCTMRRRYTGDGMLAAAALAAAATSATAAAAAATGSTPYSPPSAASAAAGVGFLYSGGGGGFAGCPSARARSPLGPYRAPAWAIPSSAVAAAASVAAGPGPGAYPPGGYPAATSAYPSRCSMDPGAPPCHRIGSTGTLCPSHPLRHSYTTGSPCFLATTSTPRAYYTQQSYAHAAAAAGAASAGAGCSGGPAEAQGAVFWPGFQGFPVAHGSVSINGFHTGGGAAATAGYPACGPMGPAISSAAVATGSGAEEAAASAALHCPLTTAATGALDVSDFSAGTTLQSMSSRVFGSVYPASGCYDGSGRLCTAPVLAGAVAGGMAAAPPYMLSVLSEVHEGLPAALEPIASGEVKAGC